jgi:sulfur carrier protein ThiS
MKLYLGGFFSFYHPQRKQWMDIGLPTPQLLREVLEQHGIPPAEVHLAVVNQELVDLDTAFVTNEDEVRLYPPIGGG